MSSSEWTPEELGETLYKIDENAIGVIHEIKQVVSSNSTNDISDKKPLDHDPYYKSQESEPEYLKLDLQGDVVHIIEFYAPWCPHCQHFKPHFIDLARELQRRTIATQIYFHAVSCTLNEIVCDTYEIAGFPTVMGWRGGEDYANFNDITKPGLVLNEEGEIDADSVADVLLFALAEDEMVNMTPESKFSNSQDQRQWEEKKEQSGLETAKEHLAMMEYEADVNERYHNAAVSLAYLLKTSVYESSKGYLHDKNAHVLYDFLILVDWASPFQWDFRSQFIQVLLNRFNSDVIAGKRVLVDLVESIQGRSFKTGNRREELLWGHLNESRSKRFHTRRAAVKSGLGGEAESYEFHVSFKTILKEHSQWTDACTHKTVSKGYTCGLWDLFHILTIGSIQFQNRMYGIHKGYIVSSRHVAMTIRNFIGSFFRCDVCRENFLKMYDNCSHDNCIRLSDDQLLRTEEGKEEIVLWLWEVHNAVNLRIMKEAAEREGREISKEEIVSSKFPSKQMCHACWLDREQNSWDSSEIFNFLNTWYWPMDESSTSSVARQMSSMEQNDYDLSWSGFYLSILPLMCVLYLLIKDCLPKERMDYKWKQNKSK